MRYRPGINVCVKIWLLVWLTATGVAGCVTETSRMQSLHPEPILVSTEWVADHMHDPDVILVDMALGPYQYRRFHLPGAHSLPYEKLVIKDRDGVSRRIPDQDLFTLLGRTGITSRHHVVIYDEIAGLQAARLFWELERIGHPRVSVVNGGLVRWILQGRKVVAEVPPVKMVSYTPIPGKGRENEIDVNGIEAIISDSKVTLLDTRTQEEYRGNAREKRSGHIPGARLWPWEQAVDFEQEFKLKPASQILASLRTVGVEDNQANVVLYCRSGHRAAHTYLTLRYLGFEHLRLYDGSMKEYIRKPGLPLRKGDAP